MNPPDRPSAALEATWRRLHWHLDATAHQPSVVFVSCDDRRDEDILRRRTEDQARRTGWPAVYEPNLALSLDSYSTCLQQNGRADEALTAVARSAEIFERLAVANVLVYGDDLATAGDRHVALLEAAGRDREAAAARRRYDAVLGR